jgi:hypothetical protein
MCSRSAKGGEKGGPNRNPWLAKMPLMLPTRLAGDDDYLRGATSINHQVALRANFKMYSRSAKGGEKRDPNRNPWLAKMHQLAMFVNGSGRNEQSL